MDGTAPEAWQELLGRAAGGDEDARSTLATQFLEKVRSLVHGELQHDFRKNHRWILPLFSTQDMVQEVLAGALRDLSDTDFPDEAAFVRYLGTIVRNRLLDAVRYHEAHKRDSRRNVSAPTASVGGVDGIAPAPTDPTPSLAASMAERARVLREVLEDFSDRHRLLLQGRLMEERTFPQLAEELGYSSDETARQAFWDAQAKLLVKLRARGIQGSAGGTLG